MPFFELGIHRNNAREFGVATVCGSLKVRNAVCLTERVHQVRNNASYVTLSRICPLMIAIMIVDIKRR